VSRARDLPRANKLVTEGKTAIERGDTEELRRVVKALWQLLPDDSEARKRGFDSGVR
jgi:molecular chaperone DnaK